MGHLITALRCRRSVTRAIGAGTHDRPRLLPAFIMRIAEAFRGRRKESVGDRIERSFRWPELPLVRFLTECEQKHSFVPKTHVLWFLCAIGSAGQDRGSRYLLLHPCRSLLIARERPLRLAGGRAPGRAWVS